MRAKKGDWVPPPATVSRSGPAPCGPQRVRTVGECKGDAFEYGEHQAGAIGVVA